MLILEVGRFVPKYWTHVDMLAHRDTPKYGQFVGIPSKNFAAGLRPAVGALSVHFAGPIAERNPNLHTPVDVKGDHEQALQICSVKMKAFGSQNRSNRGVGRRPEGGSCRSLNIGPTYGLIAP